MHLAANDGGCWFCETDEPPLVFQTEFDSYVHEECVVKELQGCNPEAIIIARELGIEIPPECEVLFDQPEYDYDSESTEDAFEGIEFE